MEHLGLLQLRADYQGRGLVRTFHENLRAMFPGPWRLTIVDTNAHVVPVWEHLGYGATGKHATWTSSSGLQHQTIEMEAPGNGLR